MTRGQTAVVIAVLVGVAFAIGHFADKASRESERLRQAEARFIQNHQCVLAQMQGRWVSQYRCDLPTPGEYLTARELARRALKELGELEAAR